MRAAVAKQTQNQVIAGRLIHSTAAEVTQIFRPSEAAYTSQHYNSG